MKKLLILSVLVVSFCNLSKANNGSRFKIDETALDAQFDRAENITSEVNQLLINNNSTSSANNPVIDSKQQTAAIVALVQVCTGIGWFVPVHRFILGTNGNDVTILFVYFCTGGGCGVGLILDTVFLFINFDKTNYENNPNIIMWKEDI